MFFLYNVFGYLGAICFLPWLLLLVMLSDKRRKTFFQRLGLKPLPEAIRRQQNIPGREKPIWIHALSVGEVLSAVALVKTLKQRLKGRDLFLSVSTLTGFHIAQSRLKREVAAFFFFPYDLHPTVRHRIRCVNPALVVMVETDIWPNFMTVLNKKRIPSILINARISDRSFNGFRRLPRFFSHLFSLFHRVCTQTNRDTERLVRLGVPAERIITAGNIKFDQAVDPLSVAEQQQIKHDLGIGPSERILVAGSTHEGEERILRDTYHRLKRRFPDLKLIIAPRDPGRTRQIMQLFANSDFDPFRVSELNQPAPPKRSEVMIIDTIGILDRIYALADIAFVGGSLVPCGGHNPLEPAAFAKPVLFGPDMSDFKAIARMLKRQGGAREVRDAEDLFHTAAALLSQRENLYRMGRLAHDVFCANRGALARTLREIFVLIDRKNRSEEMIR